MGVYAGIFQNILINVVSGIAFWAYSYFVHKFLFRLNLINLHSFQNPGSPAIFACISSPKHPDKSSSRLPAVETAHMRSAGLHADRCLCIFPLPILQRIPRNGNTASLLVSLSLPVSFRIFSFFPDFLSSSPVIALPDHKKPPPGIPKEAHYLHFLTAISD